MISDAQNVLNDLDVDMVISNLKEYNELDEGFIADDYANEDVSNKEKDVNIGQIIENEELINVDENVRSLKDKEYLQRLMYMELEAHIKDKLSIQKSSYNQIMANVINLSTKAKELTNYKKYNKKKSKKNKSNQISTKIII